MGGTAVGDLVTLPRLGAQDARKMPSGFAVDFGGAAADCLHEETPAGHNLL
jgi:hypothetical protein